MAAQPDNAAFEATLRAAHEATARRAHAEAVDLLSRALGSAPAGVGHTTLLLELAHSRYRAGETMKAWRTCCAVADIARSEGDAATMADAAVVLRNIDDLSLAAEIHELCIEAMALLGATDPVRSARLRGQLAVSGSAWVATRYFEIDGAAASDAESPDPDAAFLALSALHVQNLSVEHVHDRLAIAERSADLGRRHGVDEYLAWGLLRRMDGLYQLGHLVDLTAELAVLTAVVTRMRQPLWRWRLVLVKCSLLHLEGRYEEALVLAGEARGIAEASGDTAADMMHLIMSSDIAVRTGLGLDEAEASVRVLLDGAPYFARGWLATILVAQDRRPEVEVLWKAIRPHLDEFPRHTPEWLIGAVGHATVCLYLGDVSAAAQVYRHLLPFEQMQAVANSQTPSQGPVALHLGRLAALLGDADAATRHLESAVALAEGIGSPVFARQALAELEKVSRESGVSGRADAGHRHPLTARETEVTSLVAEGLGNRAIASRLFLSERTVENHVANALHKLGIASRSGLAVWYLTERGTGSRGSLRD